mmetsp:Transcript_32235/g.63833  ORF Transcript_32235/g.63833 Transcript_32235/m.63833 type:complete len:211 (+) Transcript_32235:166-798(+)
MFMSSMFDGSSGSQHGQPRGRVPPIPFRDELNSQNLSLRSRPFIFCRCRQATPLPLVFVTSRVPEMAAVPATAPRLNTKFPVFGTAAASTVPEFSDFSGPTVVASAVDASSSASPPPTSGSSYVPPSQTGSTFFRSGRVTSAIGIGTGTHLYEQLSGIGRAARVASRPGPSGIAPPPPSLSSSLSSSGKSEGRADATGAGAATDTAASLS